MTQSGRAGQFQPKYEFATVRRAKCPPRNAAHSTGNILRVAPALATSFSASMPWKSVRINDLCRGGAGRARARLPGATHPFAFVAGSVQTERLCARPGLRSRLG